MSIKSIKIMTSFLLIFIICSTTTAATQHQNEWDIVTNEFSLNHEVNHPEVQKQIKKILKHPEEIKKITQQAKPYLYHIMQEIKKRNLPGELALIPMIESEYDPFVKSHAGAAGLWQLMPQTSREHGIPKSASIDGRKNIEPSTSAALDYLAYLHHYFHGNWKLAVAAYDSGEGRVSRAMKQSRQKQFWSLSLPQETKAYIPHLLALSEIIEHPDRYHVEVPEIPHKPYFKAVEIDNHIPPQKAATLTDAPTNEIKRLNAGFKDWSHQPAKPYKLLVPTEHVENFYKNLAYTTYKSTANIIKRVSLVPRTPAINIRYTVKKGDSLKRIAQHHHLKISVLKKLNPNIKRGKVKPGEELFV